MLRTATQGILSLLLIMSNLNAKLMEGFPPPEIDQVTTKNWLQPPYNRWGFHHVRQLSPTANVFKGKNPIFPLKNGKKSLLKETFPLPNGIKITLKELLEHTYTDAFLVLKNGKIVAEYYTDGMQPDSQHILWSLTKSITGMLTGIIVDQGLLDLNKLVVDYIPELKNSAYSDAKVQDLLDMTVAIDETHNKKFCGLECQKGWSIYEFVQNVKKDGEHGEAFSYTNPNAIVLGWVLERTSKIYLPTLLSELIWSQLGAEGDGYFVIDRIGTANPSCGLSATLRDLGRFGQMILQNGHFNGKQIVPHQWIKDTRFNGNKKKFQNGDYGYFIPNGSYRNLWWVTGSGPIMAMGAFGQLLFIDFNNDIVIVKLSSQPTGNDLEMHLLTHQAVASIIEKLK